MMFWRCTYSSYGHQKDNRLPMRTGVFPAHLSHCPVCQVPAEESLKRCEDANIETARNRLLHYWNRPEHCSGIIGSSLSQSRSLDLLNIFTHSDDFVYLGNLMLDILMVPHQERHPDQDAKLLTRMIDAIVARKFDIPETLHYGCIYRDEHLGYCDRGSWDRDLFVHLIIMAYVVGASRTNLPPNHDQLVPYYHETADLQRKAILAAAEQHANRRARQESGSATTANLAQKIKSMIEMGLSPEAIAAQVVAETQKGPSAGRAANPGDLYH